MKRVFWVALAVCVGGSMVGCLDMSMREPVMPRTLDCPDGFTALSRNLKSCPDNTECRTVVDEENPSNTQICVEYHVDIEGGGGINCPAGYISVSQISSSSNSEIASCFFADSAQEEDYSDNDSETTEIPDDQYACIEGYKSNRFCRLVPPDDTNSRINVLMGQRCTDAQANPGKDTLRVHLMDVGQGDAIWIQTPGGQNVLIDGGDGGSFGKTSAGPIVTDYLSFHGFPAGSTFDLVILTHPHADHFGGFNNIFNVNSAYSYKLNNYMDPMDLNDPNPTPNAKIPASYLQWLNRMQGIIPDRNNIYMPAGRVFQKGEMFPEKFFGPGITAQYITSRETYNGDDANPASIVFRLTYAGRTFLFTGDAEAEQEAEAVAAVSDLSAHFLKVCHHGSSTSSTVQFLDAVWPAKIERPQRYALISSGRKTYNKVYIPTVETITRLKDYVPVENILSTSAGDDGKEESDTFRDDNILIVVSSNGSYYACYNGTN